MKCPVCQSSKHKVLETREVSDAVTRRRHKCEKDHRWSSYEKIDSSTVDASRSGARTLPVASSTTTRSVRLSAAANATPSVSTLPVALALSELGGKGGSVSDLVLSPVSKPLSLTLTRVEHPSSQETAAFAMFYQAFPRKKKRPDALKAWMQMRCEDHALAVMDGLARHLPELRSRPPEKVPYPASWLRGEEWKDPTIAPAPHPAEKLHFAVAAEESHQQAARDNRIAAIRERIAPAPKPTFDRRAAVAEYLAEQKGTR